MRMGTVVGRVTLSVRVGSYVGERLLVTLPWKKDTYSGEQKFDPALDWDMSWAGGVTVWTYATSA